MSDEMIKKDKTYKNSKGFTDVVSSYLDSNKGESFAELLASYSSGMNEEVRVGDRVRGEIISIGRDSVFVNTGSKIDGAVDKAELSDENGELPFRIGDVLDLYIVSYNESEIRLSRAISGAGGLNLLQEAYSNRIPVEGKVTEQCKGGFYVEVIQRRAFCPVSQIDLRFTESPEAYIGKTYPFLIVRFEESGRNIVVSRRSLLEQEAEVGKKKFLENVKVGAVLQGKVTTLMPYGAFVELFPGVEGMVHVSELSWSRVEKPEEVLTVGDLLTVKVTGIEPGKKADQLKISLSVKQVTGNPWESEEELFRIGDKIRGKVTRCTNFGAFVEIAPGIEGLVHISEISWKKRVLKPEDVVKTGELVDVMVKEIDMAKHRISLSIRDAEGDPWTDVTGKYAVGQSVEGTIEKKEKFGYFVTLEPGVTGLLPKSKIAKSEKPSVIEKLKEGDAITVTIEEIHPDSRKITLGTGDAAEEGNWHKYAKDVKKPSVGSFGEKLQNALDFKK
jgi:small subunit ribosomal protein S1